MERQYSDALTQKAYAIFGKSKPTDSILEAVYDVTQTMDDNSMEFIVERIRNLDDFPKNLSKAVWGFYRDWQNTKGTANTQGETCRSCEGEGGYWIYHVSRDEFTFSPCPQCSGLKDVPDVVGLMRKYSQNPDGKVIPPTAKNLIRWLRENGYRKEPQGGARGRHLKEMIDEWMEGLKARGEWDYSRETFHYGDGEVLF